MSTSYQAGDLIVYKVEYKDQTGAIKGKPRPLIIASEPNSKGDYLAIAGSTQIHQWLGKAHHHHQLRFIGQSTGDSRLDLV